MTDTSFPSIKHIFVLISLFSNSDSLALLVLSNSWKLFPFLLRLRNILENLKALVGAFV